VHSDDRRGLEVYEYLTDRTEDLDVWYAHDGVKVLYLVAGQLTIEFEQHPAERLGPGDSVIHSSRIPHRWVIEEDGPVRLLIVVVRPPV
jgi:quercetin dioxygenase-like cupin family protein